MLYQIDTDYGEIAKKKAIIQLQNFSKITLIKLDYYNTFDFYNEEQQLYIELKSRHCQVNTYTSTMIGMNKLNKAKILSRKKCNIYSFFYFTNTNYSECDLYYYKFNIDELDQLIYKSGGRIDRGKNEIKKYAYIPITLLIKI